MGLFKYLQPARVDVVENCRIRFTPASAFNDPFECLPDSRLIENPAWQRQNESDVVAEILVDDAIQSVRENRPMRWSESRIRNAHSQSYRRRMPQLKALAQKELCRAREPFRILCFSQVPPDAPAALLLWGHYTGDHCGLVVEFDPNHEWITSHMPAAGQHHDCGPVIYANDRQGWNVSDSGAAEPQREFVFTKSAHWSYEEEYRLIRFAGGAGLDAQIIDSLASFPPRAIISVTIGDRALDEIVARLTTACRALQLRHVQLRQARIHPDEFALTLHSL